MGFTELAHITLGAGENQLYDGVIDTVNNFAYFISSTNPIKIVKVDLSTFTEVATLTLIAGETFDNGVRGTVIDATLGFLWVRDLGNGRLIKVNLSTFTVATRGTPGSLPSNGADLLIDTTNQIIYWANGGGGGTNVYKVNYNCGVVTSFSYVAHSSSASAGVIDVANQFAYWGANPLLPADVLQINLNPFGYSTKISLPNGDSSLNSGVIAGGFIYFISGANPAKIVKISTSPFSRIGNITLNAGERGQGGASTAVDVINGWMYATAGISAPFDVVRINLSTFARQDSVTPAEGGALLSAINDPNGFVYIGDHSSPGIVIKLQGISQVLPILPKTFGAQGLNRKSAPFMDWHSLQNSLYS